MRTTLLLVILLSFAFTSSAFNLRQDISNEGDLDEDDLKRVNYYIAGLRGLWTGFERALYSDLERQVSSQCFSPTLAADLLFVLDFVEGKESVSTIIQFVLTTARLFNENMSNCGYTQAVVDIQKYCRRSGVNCSPLVLIQNVADEFYTIISEVWGLRSLAEGFPPRHQEDFYLTTLQVGLVMGEIIRTVFDFTQ